MGGRERAYVEWFMRSKSARQDFFSVDDISPYLEAYGDADALSESLRWYEMLTTSAAAVRNTLATAPYRGPAVVIAGSQARGERMVREVADLLPQATGHVLEGVGHYVPQEAPADVSRVLLQLVNAGKRVFFFSTLET